MGYMGVEKTIGFIPQQQAKAQARADVAEAKADRQMAAIRKLIQAGMKLIVENEEQIKALAVTQGLIDALRRGGNGRMHN